MLICHLYIFWWGVCLDFCPHPLFSVGLFSYWWVLRCALLLISDVSKGKSYREIVAIMQISCFSNGDKKNRGSTWIYFQRLTNYYIWDYVCKEKHALDKVEDLLITKSYHSRLVPAFPLVFTIALTPMTQQWDNSFLMQYFWNQGQ